MKTTAHKNVYNTLRKHHLHFLYPTSLFKSQKNLIVHAIAVGWFDIKFCFILFPSFSKISGTSVPSAPSWLRAKTNRQSKLSFKHFRSLYFDQIGHDFISYWHMLFPPIMILFLFNLKIFIEKALLHILVFSSILLCYSALMKCCINFPHIV